MNYAQLCTTLVWLLSAYFYFLRCQVMWHLYDNMSLFKNRTNTLHHIHLAKLFTKTSAMAWLLVGASWPLSRATGLAKSCAELREKFNSKVILPTGQVTPMLGYKAVVISTTATCTKWKHSLVQFLLHVLFLHPCHCIWWWLCNCGLLRCECHHHGVCVLLSVSCLHPNPYHVPGYAH